MFLKHLLYVRHCARGENKTDMVHTLMELVIIRKADIK